MLRSILANNVVQAIELLEELIVQGRELGQFVTDFVWYLRNLLLVKSSDQMEDVLDMSCLLYTSNTIFFNMHFYIDLHVFNFKRKFKINTI